MGSGVAESSPGGRRRAAARSRHGVARVPRVLHGHVAGPVEQIGGTWVLYVLGDLPAAHATAGGPLRAGVLAWSVLTEQPGAGPDDGRRLAPLPVTEQPAHRVLDVVDSWGGAAAGLGPLSGPSS